MATTYWDYVRVDDLLSLQGGNENDESRISNHEVLFITVHQVFELWFKLVKRELVSLRDLFKQDPVPENALADAAHALDRMTRIFRIAAQHFEIVETLNTRDYLDFRDKLFPASGFQSAQMRELEILLGITDEERIGLGAKGAYMKALENYDGSTSTAYAHVEAAKANTPTLKRALGDWLYRTPIRGSQPEEADDEAAVARFLEDYLACMASATKDTLAVIREAGGTEDMAALEARHEAGLDQARAFFLCDDLRERRIRASILFIESYRELPLLAWPRKILAYLIQFEQAMVVWRQRHARMVERVIGRRVGTGGSSGVDYLDASANSYRVFKDLWAVRTFQLRQEDLPPLEDTAPYEFKASFDA